MRIGICDDNLEEAKLIEEVCKATYDAECIEYELIMFDGAEDVLAFNEDIHLLILDIEMPGMSGLELKEKLQSGYRETSIIYVTSHNELMPEAFGLQVYGFVTKQNVMNTLPDYLRKYLKFVSPSIILDEGISSREILYIKAAGEYQDFHLKNGEVIGIRRTMYECEELLRDLDFIQIHRSYIVNLAYVEKVHNNKVYIEGYAIDIADRMMKATKDKFREYCKRKSRYC